MVWRRIKTKEARMAIQSHINSLKHRHQQLEEQLQQEMSGTIVRDMEVAEIKRKKLAIKDKIEALQARA